MKALVERLQADNRAEVRSHVTRDTSWGQVEVLARAPGYDMRLITVNPARRCRSTARNWAEPSDRGVW